MIAPDLCCLCGTPVSPDTAAPIVWAGMLQRHCPNCHVYAALHVLRYDVAQGFRSEWLGVLAELERARIEPHRNRVERRELCWDWEWDWRAGEL